MWVLGDRPTSASTNRIVFLLSSTSVAAAEGVLSLVGGLSYNNYADGRSHVYILTMSGSFKITARLFPHQ